MVFELTSNCNHRPPSSSSSCTEYINEANNGFNHCRQCCINSAINDHTYAVLKKICRKIIKGFERQKCREQYAVFDGGNSLNVRIHRSSSNNGAPGDSNNVTRGRQGHSGQQGREDNRDEFDAINRKRDGGTSSKSKTRGDKDGDNEIKGDQAKGGKSGKTKSGHAVDDEITSKSRKSKTGGKSQQGEEDTRSKLINEKRKSIQSGPGTALDKNKNNNDYDDKRNKTEGNDPNRKTRIQGNDSNKNTTNDGSDPNRKTKIQGNDSNKNTTNDGSDLNRKTKIQGNDSNKNTTIDGSDPNRRLEPGDVPIIANLRLKVRNGEKVGLDGSETRNGMGSWGGELSKSRKNRNSQQGTGKRRKSESSRASRKSQSNIRGGSRVRDSASKLSRADEARPCDYLRANMEQRDISRLCNRSVCTLRGTCSELIQPCFQQPISCLCADLCTTSTC